MGEGPIQLGLRLQSSCRYTIKRMGPAQRNILERLIVSLAILAMTMLGAAHRPVGPADPKLLAFLEIGGTLDAICLDGADSDAAHPQCPACTLREVADLRTAAGRSDLSPDAAYRRGGFHDR